MTGSLLLLLSCSGECPDTAVANCGVADTGTPGGSDTGSSPIDTGDPTDTAPVTPTWYHDGDSDGYGDTTSPFQSDQPPSGYVEDGTDCDDTRADVNPGAEEEWGDAIDNDCDGTVDDPESVEGRYTGTVSMSIHLVGSSTCSWYGGTYLTCDGTASATAYASPDGAVMSGTFSCTATGGGSSCGDGTVFAGDFLWASSGGAGFSGDMSLNNGRCYSYVYDGTATTTATLAGARVTGSFEVYTCLIDLADVTATVDLARTP